MNNRFLIILFAFSYYSLLAEWKSQLMPFLELHCFDCHGDGAKKGGLAMDKLSEKLEDPEAFATWERIYERAINGEMPPQKVKDRPGPVELIKVRELLGGHLSEAHSKVKGTVLRRLNRREYENTMNDLFGTRLSLADLLPEDGHSHEFNNIGSALGLSMEHLKQYIHAAGLIFDQTVRQTHHPYKQTTKKINFEEREINQHVGKSWKRLTNGAIVHFYGGGYPTGLLRQSRVQREGLYKISLTGYGYQTDKAVTCLIQAESYEPGSPKLHLGTASFLPKKSTTVELEVWLDHGYMIKFDPQGIYRVPGFEHMNPNTYKGKGFAFIGAVVEGPLSKGYPGTGYDYIFEGIDRHEVEPNHPSNREKHWYKPKFELICEDENKTIQKFLFRVGSLAFRQSVTNEEMEDYFNLFGDERKKGESLDSALKTVFCALFSSPRFLYLNEPLLNFKGGALASRLHLFLARSLGHKELVNQDMDGVKGNNLKWLRPQTEMLLHAKSFERFIEDFTNNWLDLRNIDFTSPDRVLFPEYDLYLKTSMLKETRAFVQYLFKENLPVSNFVKSDFAMLNERLAQHYGVPGVTGHEIRRVSLPVDLPRGGLLAQASVLKVTANGTNTSPVLRGVWVMERILGQMPSPPPPLISGVEPDIRGAETLRDLLEKHRSMISCQGCHAKFDPLGFALESFNPIGGYRENYRSLNPQAPSVEKKVRAQVVRYKQGPLVDASGHFVDGAHFTNFKEFQNALVGNEKTLARAFVQKLLTFGTGRELGFSDKDEIDRIINKCAANKYRVGDLLHAVVASTIFQSK